MSEWMEYKIGDIVTFQRGHDLPRDEMKEGQYPVAGSNSIIGFHNKFTTDGPGITIGRSGNIGNPQLHRTKFWAHNTTLYVKEFKLVEPFFFFYLLKTLDFTQLNSGSAVPSLNRNFIHPFKVKIPDLPTQTAIAEILSSLDDKIELNNKINQELENLAQTLFKRWFVDFEFPNENGEPYQSSGGEMVDSELGEIPKGWEVTSLGSLLKLIIDYRGKTPLKLGMNWCEVGIKAISAKNVKSRALTNLDNVHIGSQALYNIWMKDELMFGDVLLTSEAPLGETAILLERHKFILSQRLFALRANEKISPYFLFEYLSSDIGKNELKRRQSGSTVVGIKQKELLQITLISPSIEIIKRHCDLVSDIYKLIEKNNIANQELTNLRDTLLPKLISGELEVKQVLSQTT
jgi:type I restriction enzyme S subunit